MNQKDILFIGSSSSNSTFKGKKKFIPSYGTRGNALSGIDADIRNFRNYWGEIGDS